MARDKNQVYAEAYGANPETYADKETLMAKYQYGDRVKLAPFEGEPEQKGTVLEESEKGVITVQLDKQFYNLLDGDDGLREVSRDQIVACVPKDLVPKTTQEGIYCHPYSVAGGVDTPVYHDPLVCSEGKEAAEVPVREVFYHIHNSDSHGRNHFLVELTEEVNRVLIKEYIDKIHGVDFGYAKRTYTLGVYCGKLFDVEEIKKKTMVAVFDYLMAQGLGDVRLIEKPLPVDPNDLEKAVFYTKDCIDSLLKVDSQPEDLAAALQDVEQHLKLVIAAADEGFPKGSIEEEGEELAADTDEEER